MANATSRRSLFAGATAVVMGAGITAGADMAPVNQDAELIALCERFNVIELRCRARLDSAHTAEEEDRAEEFRKQLCGGKHHQDWPVFNRVCTTPGSSYAAAVALASSIAIFNTGKVVGPEDDPEGYMTDRLTAALIRCLLGSA